MTMKIDSRCLLVSHGAHFQCRSPRAIQRRSDQHRRIAAGLRQNPTNHCRRGTFSMRPRDANPLACFHQPTRHLAVRILLYSASSGLHSFRV